MAWAALAGQLWLTVGIVVGQGRGVAMGLVVYFEFFTVLTNLLAAGAGYAESSKQISSKLTGKQRDLSRRARKAWIGDSTAACEFETSGLQSGSAQGMARWQCAA